MGIGVVLLALAAVAGIAEARWSRAGLIALAAIGVAAAAIALTRADAGLLAWLPSVLADVTAAPAPDGASGWHTIDVTVS